MNLCWESGLSVRSVKSFDFRLLFKPLSSFLAINVLKVIGAKTDVYERTKRQCQLFVLYNSCEKDITLMWTKHITETSRYSAVKINRSSSLANILLLVFCVSDICWRSNQWVTVDLIKTAVRPYHHDLRNACLTTDPCIHDGTRHGVTGEKSQSHRRFNQEIW